ncbi:serine/threonine-protein phosphatase 4 regulatory subunit 2-like [Impatiens glandulifera]|uniref:serine/threonine-protein phosphatase 4 regulatory subunit 2-like n=1 Tax=Impatiens glandulifera TaxID=253017 RepID=UPI001FB05604|nr:serine/threonine-protein phosphatase 4 regulatory subunit 2-like [Impatiens glandulifera]
MTLGLGFEEDIWNDEPNGEEDEVVDDTKDNGEEEEEKEMEKGSRILFEPSINGLKKSLSDKSEMIAMQETVGDDEKVNDGTDGKDDVMEDNEKVEDERKDNDEKVDDDEKVEDERKDNDAKVEDVKIEVEAKLEDGEKLDGVARVDDVEVDLKLKDLKVKVKDEKTVGDVKANDDNDDNDDFQLYNTPPKGNYGRRVRKPKKDDSYTNPSLSKMPKTKDPMKVNHLQKFDDELLHKVKAWLDDPKTDNSTTDLHTVQAKKEVKVGRRSMFSCIANGVDIETILEGKEKGVDGAAFTKKKAN